MPKTKSNQTSKRPLYNHEEYANYRTELNPEYQGNPLIEALPEIPSKEQVFRHLVQRPFYEESQRELAPEIRLNLVLNLLNFFTPLGHHYHLAWQIDSLIRLSYRHRNPVDINFWNELQQDVKSINPTWFIPIDEPATATSISILGISGIGKSTTTRRIMSFYKPVIIHSFYAGRNLTLKQIVWLKLDCPNDGSIKGLCLNFFQKVDSLLGTSYYKNYAKSSKTVDELIPLMANIAAIHCIGLLIIDEIQNLHQAKSGGAKKMLNIFVQLINTLNISIVLIGTYKAWSILCDEFRQIRRGTGLGDFIWGPMENDATWRTFVSSFWCYQYTKYRCEIDDVIETLYDESAGITDYAIKLYLLAQVRAIQTGKELITSSIIQSVAYDCLQTARLSLQALRIKDWNTLTRYEMTPYFRTGG